MNAAFPDLATTRFVLPADVGLVAVRKLAPRHRAELGAADPDAVVLTRQGFRVTTRLVPAPLAALLAEFREPSLLTDAVLRFSQKNEEPALTILDLSFDALADLINGKILVASSSPAAKAASASLAIGDMFGEFEIEWIVRALDDSEVFRARTPDGTAVALKIARIEDAAETLAHEAATLAKLERGDTPRLLAQGIEGGRAWIATEWRDGVAITIAAQRARAARDRRTLHRLILGMLEAFERLHADGILHGDIHPSNILAGEGSADADITILDFGRARRVADAGKIDPYRTGIPHFYDPQLAAAVLDGVLPPASTPASEQFALATLAYRLATGHYPFRQSAEREEMLRRVVSGAFLPFAARGVDSWPGVETVLQRALAKAPEERFADVSEFAAAFRRAGRSLPRRGRPTACDAGLIDALASGGRVADVSPAAHAWLALRAALVRSDATLLAVAQLWAARGDEGWEYWAVAASVARSACDRTGEQRAIEGFLAAVSDTPDSASDAALLWAARMVDGADIRGLDAQQIRSWAVERLAAALSSNSVSEEALRAGLAHAGFGPVPWNDEIQKRLASEEGGSVWLWTEAWERLEDPGYLSRALSARRPSDKLGRGLACLRLYQVTGDPRWIRRVRRHLSQASHAADSLLSFELAMPSRMVAPPPAILSEIAKAGPS